MECTNYAFARSIDRLGRVVIPKEMRSMLDWNETDQVYIGVKDGVVYMKKFSSICPLCRTPYNLDDNKKICEKCIKKIMR